MGHNQLIRVCSITFASKHWYISGNAIRNAIDLGQIRAYQLQQGRWWVNVDDLNKRWGNHAPQGNDYLYINGKTLPSNTAQGVKKWCC